MTENTTHRIHSSNVAELELRIEKANRRAARAEIAERFSFEVTGEFHKEHENGEVEVYFEYNLSTPALKYADWELVAAIVIEEGGTVLRIREGKDELIAGWQRPDTHECASCNITRYRTKSYVVVNSATGEIAQVGSDCLQRYTGIRLGDLWILDAFDAETLAEWAEESAANRSNREGGPREARSFSVDKLVRIAYVVSEGGKKFVSQSAARDFEKIATSGRVFNVLFPGNRQKARDEAAAVLREAAQIEDSVIAEILASAETVFGEYGENLRAVTRSTVISGRSIGLLVSVVSCWFRATEQKREDNSFAKGFVGAVKERLRNRKVVISKVRIVESHYGDSTLVLFRDVETNKCFKWFASGNKSELDAGQEVTLTGTVKAHEQYNDLDQTVLTRCVIAA